MTREEINKYVFEVNQLKLIYWWIDDQSFPEYLALLRRVVRSYQKETLCEKKQS